MGCTSRLRAAARIMGFPVPVQRVHQQGRQAAGARDGPRLGQPFTLAEARERARLQRQLLADGLDPIECRKRQDGPSRSNGNTGAVPGLRQAIHQGCTGVTMSGLLQPEGE